MPKKECGRSCDRPHVWEPDLIGLAILQTAAVQLEVLGPTGPNMHGADPGRRRVGMRHGDLRAEDAAAVLRNARDVLVAREGGGSNGREQNGRESDFGLEGHGQSPVRQVLPGLGDVIRKYSFRSPSPFDLFY